MNSSFDEHESKAPRVATKQVAVQQRYRLLALLLAMVGAVLLSLNLGLSAASAHDQLVDSNPKEGEHLDRAPGDIELKFSGTPSEIGTELALEGTDGGRVELPEHFTIDGNSVKQTLPELGDGAYKLNWRVVSSDGHPIAGTLAFTVGEAQAPAGEVGGINNHTHDVHDENHSAAEKAANEMPAWLPIAFAIVGVAVIAMAAVALVRRFRGDDRPDFSGMPERDGRGATAVRNDAATGDIDDTDLPSGTGLPDDTDLPGDTPESKR